MTITYPDGYGTRRLTLDELRERHAPRMHPEFARRFFAYLEHKKGALGIGGGFRTTQPTLPGFAPDGQSFHQAQTFASGTIGYCAADLVAPDGPDADASHDGVTWEATADAPLWGLHTFIKTPEPEPWHIQPIEIRGWQSWVNAGRPDPQPIQLPEETPVSEPKLAYYLLPPADYPPGSPEFVVIDASIRYRNNVDVDGILPSHRVPADQYENQRKSSGL